MDSLSAGFKRSLHHHADSPIVRQRMVEQALLLRQLNYLKGSFSLPEHLLMDAKTFEKFLDGLLSPSRLSKNLKEPVLHSFVITLLIALGDDARLRRKVGAFMQKTDKQYKKLASLFEKHPDYYGHYLSLLPFESGSRSGRLLALA